MADNNGAPSKKRFGLRMQMTAGRWLMVGTGTVAAVVVVGFLVFNGKSDSTYSGASVASQAGLVGQNTPGVSSPEYAKEADKYNKQKQEAAEKTGQSFVAIPVLKEKKADLSNINFNPSQNQAKKAPPPAPAPIVYTSATPNNNQPNSGYSGGPTDSALNKEIAMVSKSFATPDTPYTVVTHLPTETQVQARYQAKESATNASPANSSKGKEKADSIPLHPGQLIYGVFQLELDSSVPGPVLGELVQGKWNGYKVLGSFTKPSGSNLLVIKFSKLVAPDGKVESISGYAIDPKSTLPAMGPDVDYHVLSRIGNFLGATFLAGVEGYGQTISQAGSSISTNGLSTTTSIPPLSSAQEIAVAGGYAANEFQPLQQQMQENVEEPNTVKVPANTPFVLLVVDASSGSGGLTGNTKAVPAADGARSAFNQGAMQQPVQQPSPYGEPYGEVAPQYPTMYPQESGYPVYPTNTVILR